MPAIDSADLAALRDQKGQYSKFYLGVLVPHTVHSSQINNSLIERGARTIAFDSGSYGIGYGAGYPNTIGISAGMTLWIGTTAGSYDICKLRIRSFTSGDGGITGNFAVCEHNFPLSDNYYLTVKEEFRLWPRHPIAVPDTIVKWYMDYDIPYSGQNRDVQRDPVVRMGPPAAAIRDATTGQATVNFWSDSGAAPGGNAPSSYAWRWRKETGNWETAATAGTEGSPHSVTWNGPDNFLARLTLDGSTHGYRPVFIFDPTGTSSAYEDFEIQNLGGEFDTGGWRMGVRVKEDCDISDFPNETMVILFAEDWYKGSKVSIGGNYKYRENVIFVGYVTKDTVRRDPFTNDVLFEAHTIDGEMRNCELFPHSLEDHTNANNNWLQIQNMTMDKGAYHILKWGSTLLDITDVHFSGDTKKLRWLDSTQKSLYEKIDDDCYEPIMARVLSDRDSIIRCELNPQFFSTAAPRDAVATIMNIETQDWRDEIQLPDSQSPICGLIDLSGVQYAGNLADVEPVFSLAYGDVMLERGKTQTVQNMVLEDQEQANSLAGNYLANQNNPYPRVNVPITNNYRVFDITPQEWITVPIAASDTYRGVTWTNDRFLPRAIRFNFNNALGALNVDLELEKETTGTAGITGYYPEEPTEKKYKPPKKPITPPIIPPGIDSWEGIRIVGCCGSPIGSQPGILRTEELGGATTYSPTWVAWNQGLDMVNYPYVMGLGRDPWDPKNRLFVTMADKEESQLDAYTSKLYRREYSGGAWGDWTVILDDTIVSSVVGTACAAVKIGRSAGNINAQGHRYVPVCAGVAAWSANVTFMFKSVDNGDNWTIGSSVWVCHSALYKHRSPLGLAVGMLQGSSPHGAGQVIWLSDREFDIYLVGPPFVYASIDQGDTWQGLCVRSVGWRGRRLHVDPNNQDILYVVEGYENESSVGKFTDPTNLAAYTTLTAWGNSQNRPPVPKAGAPNTMFSADLTVLKASYDGGATIDTITVDGNCAGAGFPLNWDWNLLQVVHAYQNGKDGTRYFQVSPDGGTTWYNKHGNMAGDFRGLVSVGFSLDN